MKKPERSSGKEAEPMTREEAQEFIDDLTAEEKVMLYEMLSGRQQNPLPSEVQNQEDPQED